MFMGVLKVFSSMNGWVKEGKEENKLENPWNNFGHEFKTSKMINEPICTKLIQNGKYMSKENYENYEEEKQPQRNWLTSSYRFCH